MYDLWVLEDPEISDITHSGVLVCHRDEWRENGNGAAFSQTVSDQYNRDGTDLFHIPIVADISRFVALLKVKNIGDTGISGVSSGKKKVWNAVIVKKANQKMRF